jgi:chaperonin cofactor prefoldin
MNNQLIAKSMEKQGKNLNDETENLVVALSVAVSRAEKFRTVSEKLARELTFLALSHRNLETSLSGAEEALKEFDRAYEESLTTA